MHIVQLIPTLNEGGVERGVVELNRELQAAGIQNTVITRGGKLVEQLKRDGARVELLDVASKNPFTALWRAWQLRGLLKRINPDIIHVRSRVPGWLVLLACPRQPIVTTVHGFNSVSRYSKIMTRGKLIICPSTSVAEHIQKHYQVDPQKIRLVHRGIDPACFSPERLDSEFIAQFKKEHELAGRYVILAVGRITRWKGLDTLLDAAAKLRERIPNLLVLIAGGVAPANAAYAESLKEKAVILGLRSDVKFLGSQAKVAEIYTCANLLVSCAVGTPEAFGRSMTEALAMNLPVVAAAHGGAIDIIREGKNGYLFTPGDSAELADKIYQTRQTQFGHLREDAFERFSLALMAQRTISVYKEVLGDTSSLHSTKS